MRGFQLARGPLTTVSTGPIAGDRHTPLRYCNPKDRNYDMSPHNVVLFVLKVQVGDPRSEGHNQLPT